MSAALAATPDAPVSGLCACSSQMSREYRAVAFGEIFCRSRIVWIRCIATSHLGRLPSLMFSLTHWPDRSRNHSTHKSPVVDDALRTFIQMKEPVLSQNTAYNST